MVIKYNYNAGTKCANPLPSPVFFKMTFLDALRGHLHNRDMSSWTSIHHSVCVVNTTSNTRSIYARDNERLHTNAISLAMANFLIDPCDNFYMTLLFGAGKALVCLYRSATVDDAPAQSNGSDGWKLVRPYHHNSSVCTPHSHDSVYL